MPLGDRGADCYRIAGWSVLLPITQGKYQVYCRRQELWSCAVSAVMPNVNHRGEELQAKPFDKPIVDRSRRAQTL